MPTPTKGPRLGGGPAHERLMLANLVTSLFEHGAITTTQAKAKRMQPLAERMVTFAKRGDLHARRRVLTVVKNKTVVHELFTEIGPRYTTRHGGYTRITKLGPRKGDNAPMARIELVEPLSEQAVAEAEAAAKRAAKDRDAKLAAEQAAVVAASAAAAKSESESESDAHAGDLESAADAVDAVDAVDSADADGTTDLVDAADDDGTTDLVDAADDDDNK